MVQSKKLFQKLELIQRTDQVYRKYWKKQKTAFLKEAVFHEAKQWKELAFSCWLSNNLSPLGHRQSKLLQLLLI